MSKGGGGSDAFATTLPPWARRAHERLIGEAEAEAYGRPYQAYGQDRLADFSGQEQQGFGARQMMFDEQDPYADYSGTQMAYAAGIPGQMEDLGEYYQAQDFDFGRFGEQEQQDYMSPYQQAVTDEELAVAREEYQRQRRSMMGEAVQSGAFGGYREAVENAIGGSLQGRQLSDIQARGSQAAFLNAQQQFERDRGAAIQAAQMGDASAFRAAQQRMNVDLANQQRLQWEGQFASGLAGQAADIGTIQQNRALQRIQELERAGATQRQMEQAKQDLAYEDFRRQEDYGWTQMSLLSQMLQGVPAGLETTTRTPAPGFGQQAVGAGVQIAGIQALLNQQGP